MTTSLKVLVVLVLVALAVYLLFTQVFPWVDRQFLIDPTLSSWAR